MSIVYTVGVECLLHCVGVVCTVCGYSALYPHTVDCMFIVIYCICVLDLCK